MTQKIFPYTLDLMFSASLLKEGKQKQSINPLKTSPEYTQAGVYGKCVFKQNQIIFNGLRLVLLERKEIMHAYNLVLFLHVAWCQ